MIKGEKMTSIEDFEYMALFADCIAEHRGSTESYDNLLDELQDDPDLFENVIAVVLNNIPKKILGKMREQAHQDALDEGMNEVAAIASDYQPPEIIRD